MGFADPVVFLVIQLVASLLLHTKVCSGMKCGAAILSDVQEEEGCGLLQTSMQHLGQDQKQSSFEPQDENEEYYNKVFDCRLPEKPLPVSASTGSAGPMHVVYASNAFGLEKLYHGVVSMIRHLQRPHACTIHMIIAKESMGEARQLVNCLSNEFSKETLPSVMLHEERPLPFDYHLTKGLMPKMEVLGWLEGRDIPKHSYGSSTAAARLLLQQYLPNVSRVLWLDIDTVVNDDVQLLYQMKMDHAVAAVAGAKNDFFSAAPESQAIAAKVNVTPDNFFNSGVLLIDLQRWQLQNLSEKVIAWGERLGWDQGDQAALNFALDGDYDHLDFRWNLNSLKVGMRLPQRCREESRILHFNWGSSNINNDLLVATAPKHQCNFGQDSSTR